MKSYLIKDTTKEQRKEIALAGISLSGLDNKVPLDISYYQEYIDGNVELEELLERELLK